MDSVRAVLLTVSWRPFYGCFQALLSTRSFEWQHCFVQNSRVIKNLSNSCRFFSLSVPKYLGTKLTHSFYAHISRILWKIFLKKNSWNLNAANTQRWFNVDICGKNVVTSVNVISTLIECRFVNVESSMKFNVETTLILGWL